MTAADVHAAVREAILDGIERLLARSGKASTTGSSRCARLTWPADSLSVRELGEGAEIIRNIERQCDMLLSGVTSS
jgi:hypothetical protein